MSHWKLSYFDIHRWHCCGHHFCHHYCFCRSYIFPDPEHQRAKGNLKYFEFQLEKQKKTEGDETKTEEKKEEKKTTEKKKKSTKKAPFQLIPERKKYEMLCRGEGIKMVSQTKRHAKNKSRKNVPTSVSTRLILSQSDHPQREPAVLPVL